MRTHLIVRGSLETEEVRRWLERPLARLRRQLVHFPSDAVLLQVLVRENEGAPRAEASLSLRLPSKTLSASEEEPDPRKALKEALEEIERLLKKEKARLRRAHRWRIRRWLSPRDPRSGSSGIRAGAGRGAGAPSAQGPRLG